ncbi:SAC3/GANP family protein, partial [Opisthorchis viverrini]
MAQNGQLFLDSCDALKASMQQWGTYGNYWQGGTYGAYPASYQGQATQTFDYNHQATTITTTTADVHDTPPPPGVDSKDGSCNPQPAVSGASPNWADSAQPTGVQPYMTQPPPYTQPHLFRFNPQRPLLPGGSVYPAVNSPYIPSQPQPLMPWNSPNYGYYSYPNANASAAAPFLPTPWGYPAPPTRLRAAGGNKPRQPAMVRSDSNIAAGAVNAPVLATTTCSQLSEAEPTISELQKPPPALEAKSTKEQWSAELKDYVQRAFCSIDTKEEKDQMERILKEKLEYIFRNNITVDWTTENIPTVPSKTIAALQNAAAAASRPSSVNSDRPTSPTSATAVKKGRRRKRGGRGGVLDSTVTERPVIAREPTPPSRGRGRGSKRVRGSNHIGTSVARLSDRANRFKDHLSMSSLSGSGSIARTTSQLLLNLGDEGDELSAEFQACQIVGTMQELEKPYLRLTRAPEPHEVRPVSVLKLALEHVKQKWITKSDYHWTCEQFKSIRQDLTVQGIEDEFAVAVYETHADAALDAGDFEEFHQCQSQLLRLYNEGLGSARVLEFTAYRLLYYMFTLDLLGMNTIMAGLRPTHKSNPCVRYALDVRSAWSLHNYRRFFRLVCPPDDGEQPPLRCGQVIQWFLERERKNALKTIFKFISDSVGLPSTVECTKLLCDQFSLPPDILEPVDKIDCKSVWNAMCQATRKITKCVAFRIRSSSFLRFKDITGSCYWKVTVRVSELRTVKTEVVVPARKGLN